MLPGNFGEFAQRLKFAELGFVVGIPDRTGAQAIAKGEGHVIGLHDFADVFEMRIQEVFLVVRETPLGKNRAATRDNPGHAAGGHRHIAQQHASVNREVIHTLFGLLNEGIAEDFPGQVLGLAIDFFESLIDRHGADGHGAVAHDPLTRFVNVLARRQIHHRIAAPADRPGELVDLFLDR